MQLQVLFGFSSLRTLALLLAKVRPGAQQNAQKNFIFNKIFVQNTILQFKKKCGILYLSRGEVKSEQNADLEKK